MKLKVILVTFLYFFISGCGNQDTKFEQKSIKNSLSDTEKITPPTPPGYNKNSTKKKNF